MANKRRSKKLQPGLQVELEAVVPSQASDIAAVKRLLTLVLVKLGATSDELGWALSVSGRRVRQVVPIKSIRKVVLSNEGQD